MSIGDFLKYKEGLTEEMAANRQREATEREQGQQEKECMYACQLTKC